MLTNQKHTTWNRLLTPLSMLSHCERLWDEQQQMSEFPMRQLSKLHYNFGKITTCRSHWASVYTHCPGSPCPNPTALVPEASVASAELAMGSKQALLSPWGRLSRPREHNTQKQQRGEKPCWSGLLVASNTILEALNWSHNSSPRTSMTFRHYYKSPCFIVIPSLSQNSKLNNLSSFRTRVA